MKQKQQFDPIEAVIDDLRVGKMVIVVDDADRENEGDLIMAAEKVTPQAVNFMVDTGASVVALNETSAARFGLRPSRSEYNATVSTANGTIQAKVLTSARVMPRLCLPRLLHASV